MIWSLRLDNGKGRATYGVIRHAVISTFNQRNGEIPVLRGVLQPKHIFERAINNFRLAISLRMTRTIELQSGLEELPQYPPEMTYKLSISVRSDRTGITYSRTTSPKNNLAT